MNQEIDNELEFIETQIIRIKKRLRDKSLLTRFLRLIILFTLVAILIVLCVSLYGKHYLDTHPQVQEELVQRVSDSFGIPIKVGELGVGWEWKGPKIVASQLSFYPDKADADPIVVFDEASVVLDLPGYLRTLVLNVADVKLSGAEIQLAQREQIWYLNDYPISALSEMDVPIKNQLDNTFDTDINLDSEFKLPLGKFSVENINFVYLNESNEELWRFDSMDAFVDNDNKNTRIKFAAEDNPLYEKLEFTANSSNEDELLSRDWQLLLDAEGLNAEQFIQDWKKLIRRLLNEGGAAASDPEKKIRLVNGSVDVKVWSQLKLGNLTALNGSVDFTNLYFEQGLSSPTRIKTIPEFSFNIDLNTQYRLLERELITDFEQKAEISDQDVSVQDLPSRDSAAQETTETQAAEKENQDIQIAKLDTPELLVQSESNILIQEEMLLRLSNLRVKSDLGAWPKSDINLKKITYRDDLVNFDLASLPEVKSIQRDDSLKGKDAAQNTVPGHQQADKRSLVYELIADYFYMGDLAPLFAVISSGVPAELAPWQFMDWRKLDGKIKDVHFKLHTEVKPDQEHTNEATINKNNKKDTVLEVAKLSFSDLSIPRVNNQLHLKGLNGQLDIENNQGTIEFTSDNFAYEHLDLFRKEIILDTFHLSADIKYQDKSWAVSTKKILLENQDIAFSGKADLSLSGNESLVDLKMQIEPKDLDKLKHYYPVKVMGAGLVEWLENGVSGGVVEKANVVLNGNLKDFPFRKGEGEFRTDFKLTDMDISYAEAWPGLKIKEADVSFVNEGLEINAQAVESDELGTLPAKAVFKDLAKQLLELEIKRESMDMQNSAKWLKRTPIYADLSSYLDNLEFIGEALIDLKLAIPLKDTKNTKLDGRLSLLNNQLKIETIDDLAEQVTGDVYITEKAVSAKGLTALLRGQSLTADVTQTTEATRIDLSGDADLGELLQSEYITGQSLFTASINVPKTDNKDVGIDTIEVASNLLGANINLPAPFAKEAESIQPLSMVFNMAGTQQETFSLIGFSGSLGTTVLQGRLFKDTNNPNSDKELQLHSLALIGDGRAEYLQQVDLTKPQLQVLGQFSRLDADEWFTFLSNLDDSQESDQMELGLVNIAIDEMNLLGQALSNAEVRVIPNTSAWQIRLLNADMNGNIRVPRPWSNTLPIETDMDRVYFKVAEEKSDTEENPLDEVDLTKIPNIDMRVSDLRYGSMDLGQFTGRIVQDGKGASLKDATIKNPEFELEASGGWFSTDQGEQTLLSMQMQSNNFARSLVRLGFAPQASARSATADIELDWQGNPLDDLLETISGKISFKLRNGTLQEVDPGAGRFLALLSIAQLPSRLSLDFRDVFGKGLKYDELSGDFLISSGQAYTNNVLMRGPVADVGIIGRVGLSTRDFEQAAVVRADFGSSLPIAGALAGGLGVGAAVLLFSEIFKKSIKDATQIFYQIEGEWGKPNIGRINPSQLKEIPIAP